MSLKGNTIQFVILDEFADELADGFREMGDATHNMVEAMNLYASVMRDERPEHIPPIEYARRHRHRGKR